MSEVPVYTYYGEFGFLNLEIIGGLEMYFQKYPNKKIIIKTYENYGKLLKHIFPNNIDYIVDNLNLEGGDRDGHFYYTKKEVLNREEVEKDLISTKYPLIIALYRYISLKNFTIDAPKNNVINLYRNKFVPAKRYLKKKNNI